MSTGRALELFFVDGNPDGMLTAEVFNWTGHVLRFPRTQLAEGLRRAEASQTGVYLLIGENEHGPFAYIGEAEDVARRVAQHAREKDWWDQVVIITATGDALNKAHVKYLESRLVEAAIQSGAVPLENGNTPPRASLNEAAVSNMEGFLLVLHIVLPAIRVDLFQTGRRSMKVAENVSLVASDKGTEFILTLPRHGITARAILIAGEMIVQAGSEIRGKWISGHSNKTSYSKIHEDLLARGIIQENGTGAILTEDFAFSAPSAAAAVVCGRSTNGRVAWKRPDGQTYADWEAAQFLRQTNDHS